MMKKSYLKMERRNTRFKTGINQSEVYESSNTTYLNKSDDDVSDFTNSKADVS